MTLLELVIVMAILGILFVLLLRTYNWISTMVFRIQQEKEVGQEIIQISQIVQNFSERNSIDYSKYWVINDEWETINLTTSQWITDVLYLTGQDGEIALYTSGSDCLDPAVEYVYTESWYDCSLYMELWGITRELINTKKILITKAMFKIIPFASEQQYIDTPGLCSWNYLQCLNSPWFWMMFTAYSTNYGKQWATHVIVPFQQFF